MALISAVNGAVRSRCNRRDVWQLKSEPTTEAHYATFPAELAELCILAGSRHGDLILDPFAGSGTVGKVCERLSRRWIGVPLPGEYVAVALAGTPQKGL